MSLVCFAFNLTRDSNTPIASYERTQQQHRLAFTNRTKLNILQYYIHFMCVHDDLVALRLMRAHDSVET